MSNGLEMKKKYFYRGRLGMTILEQNESCPQRIDEEIARTRNRRMKGYARAPQCTMTLNAEKGRLHAPSEGEMFTIVK